MHLSLESAQTITEGDRIYVLSLLADVGHFT